MESRGVSMKSNGVPWKISRVYFPVEIPWGMKAGPLLCRITVHDTDELFRLIDLRRSACRYGQVILCLMIDSGSANSWPIFTARRYASAVYAVVVCMSVRLSVRLSVGYNPTLYQTAKRRITQTTQGLKFSDAKNLDEISTASLPTGAPNKGGVSSNW